MKRIRDIAYKLFPGRHGLMSHLNRIATTQDVFTDIYNRNIWGGTSGTFYSGDGSHNDAIVSSYVAAVQLELRRLDSETLTAVDIGCGDFSIGAHLAKLCHRYIGVDIVQPLIEHNNGLYSSPHISFKHLNAVVDKLPTGDICFVRQVLQHLSNRQIIKVLTKLRQYRWCFISEHHPSPQNFRGPNMDKPHGADIRLSRGSGVFLEHPPFNVPSGRYRLLVETPGTSVSSDLDPGIIRTYLLTNGASADGPSDE